MAAKYWNNEGKYEALYEKLRKALVPNEGQADTEHGEVLRVMGNLYYDHYNNGDWNDLNDLNSWRLQKWAKEHATPDIQNRVGLWKSSSATDEDYDLVVDAVIEWVAKRVESGSD